MTTPSNQPSPAAQWAVWGGLALVIAGICIAYFRATPDQCPPSPAPVMSAAPVIARVADFALTNQAGRVVTLADLRGHPWIADIIFTRCPGPCARMTTQLHELQSALAPANRTNAATRLVSLTTDPEFDTPPVLQRYAERFAADPARWDFLTGTKLQLAAVAMDSLKLTAVEKKPEERTEADDLFMHSTIFVVVDKRGQLRGVFETGGENVDWNKSKADILSLAAELENEP